MSGYLPDVSHPMMDMNPRFTPTAPATGDRERPEDVLRAFIVDAGTVYGPKDGAFVAAFAALDALVADKAASDDVIEALAARIAELEAALDRAERERDVLQMANRKARTNIGDMHDRLAAERARGDARRAALEWVLQNTSQAQVAEYVRDALAADPEGGSPE